MSNQMKRMLLIVGIILGLIFGWYTVKKLFIWYMMSHYESPPVTISATIAAPKTWQSFANSVGTLTAVHGADISAEVSGIVKEIHVESGNFVQQGDLLILLDTGIEQAQLKDNEAQLKLAEINYDRDRQLFKKNVIPQSSLDTTLAKLQEAQAGVEATQARIKQKTITAPFSGKMGIRLVNVGEFVSAGTVMVTLQSLDPLYVRFNLPEQFLPELYLQEPIDMTVNLGTAGDTVFHGVVTAINSKVDQATRNVLVQATIPNKDLKLYPGMFAWVKVWFREQKNVITLPQTAISYSLHGNSVFLIKSEGKKKNAVLHAYRQYVEVGELRQDQVSILKGVKAGDQVATSGQLKLQNGARVVIDNSVEL